ncbi:MAG: ATP-binding protein [Gammaproteobacteria bacterium]|nr:ATP-binding protein [Gammaproteobacteria bacterium]
MSEQAMREQSAWVAANEEHLAATLKWLRLKLQQQIPAQTREESSPQEKADDSSGGWFKRKLSQPQSSARHLPPPETSDDETIKQAAQVIANCEKNDPPPALLILAQRLGLSHFDQQVLMLCSAMALDTRFATLCAQAQDDLNRPYPTFALAFSLFDDPDWNALSPHAPLRHWRLLEINQPGAQPLTSAALGTDERIINYLKGLNYLDDRLMPLLDSMVFPLTDETLPPSQQLAADNILDYLKHSNGQKSVPVIELLGHDVASKHLIAGQVASVLGLSLQSMDIKILPSQMGDFETFTRLWQRESLLMPLALYIHIDGATDAEKMQLKRFLERSNGVVFLDLEDAKTETVRNRFSVEINKPTPEEQQQLWAEALQGQANDQPQRLAEQFSFGQSEIRRLAQSALDEPTENEAALNSAIDKELWQACSIAARAGMEQLARRIDAKATWEQLVLPPEQTALLNQITDQVAQRNRVYSDWGFRQQMNRGLGINALFAGESGTGKTMAAEVIANALKLDLYRIDLSSVVSKYIGETEKNLRKLFDTAEDSGAILFFDEADALFGKRSEVKDSHDRYANIEINYLLQRIESYRGLAILATNMKSSLDKAFVRRLRFIVDFPFPGIEERTEMWQKVFPPETPIDENLDYQRLAKFNLTGGNIHSVALNAAFLAAQNGSSVTMPLLLSAARIEYKKLERPAKASDFIWQGNLEVVK